MGLVGLGLWRDGGTDVLLGNGVDDAKTPVFGDGSDVFYVGRECKVCRVTIGKHRRQRQRRREWTDPRSVFSTLSNGLSDSADALSP